MNYQRISYFIKAAETLNFSEAARQSYIAPQSFGKQITLLETELGGKLFDRTRGKMRLTPFGKECYSRFSGLVSALERTFSEMCELANSQSKRIKIGIFSALSKEKVIFPIMGSVLLNCADKDVSTSLMDMNELQEAVRTNAVDIGITATHDREGGWEDCSVYTIDTYPANLVVSKQHSWFGRKKITVEDMEHADFVRIYHPQYSMDDYFDHIPCRRVIEVENYETMIMEIRSGRAFSVMPGQIDETSEQGYQLFDLPITPFDYQLALIINNNDRRSDLEEIIRFVQHGYEA